MPQIVEKVFTVAGSVFNPGLIGVTAGLAVVASIFAPVLLTAVLMAMTFGAVAAVAVGIVKGVRNVFREKNFSNSAGESARQRGERQSQKARSASKRNGEDRVVDRDIMYDRLRGKWNISAFPIDMKPTADSDGEFILSGRNKKFDVGDMRGIVDGRAGVNGFATFSFHVGTQEAAMKISDLIRNSNDSRLSTASIKHAPDGKGFICMCVNAEGISKLLRNAEFKEKEAAVQLKLRSVKQYEVKGCRTREEAREKFERLKAENRLGELNLVNVYERIDKFIDGRELSSKFNGKFYEPKQTEFGTFIIDDMYVTTSVHKAVVAGGEMMDDEHLAHSVLSDPKATVERQDAQCEVRMDGAVLDSVRTVMLTEGKTISVDKMMSLADRTLKELDLNDDRYYIRVRMDSPEAMRDFLDVGNLFNDRQYTVVHGKGSAKEEPGVVCIPVDADMLSKLEPVLSVRDAERLDDYVNAGMSSDMLKAAVLGERLSSKGECEVTANECLAIRGALVMGVGVRELRDRLNDPDAPEFRTMAQMQQWVKDASRIESVDVSLDYFTSELTVRSTVSNGLSSSTKVETRKLSQDELESVARRLPLSDAAGKDLLMQSHPEYFRTYRDSSGKGIFADPMNDFVKGRKPETPVQRMNRQNNEKKAGAVNVLKDTAKAVLNSGASKMSGQKRNI